jgi:hypothetical protein
VIRIHTFTGAINSHVIKFVVTVVVGSGLYSVEYLEEMCIKLINLHTLITLVH